MAQYIYTLEKARKAHGDKVVLDNVTLSFLPGAKIGVVGPNGAGKSSLLRIMAGLDTAEQRRGPADARLHRRHARPGAAAQRGQDRPRQHRGGGRRDQGQAGPVQRDRRADGHRLLRRADGGDGPAPGGARPRRRVGHRLQARAGDGRAALPAAGRRRRPSSPVASAAGWRCASCCWRQPDLLLLDEPTNHLDAESVLVAGAAPGQVRRHGHRDHPRPVLPRQRGPVDPRARPRPRPTRTRATTPPTWRRRPPGWPSRAARTPRCRSASPRSWSGCAPTPRPARPSPGPGWTATRRWPPRRRRPASSTSRRSRSRRARAWATR